MKNDKISSHVFFITPQNSNQRIDKALGSFSEIGSRSRAAKLLSEDLVKLNGNLAKASSIVEEGDCIEVKIPVVSTNLIPYEKELDILFEDEDLLVVNKPAGLVVHPAEGHQQDTLVNALIHHAKDLSMGFGENRPGIVHRLDKDTSGLLVVAKNDSTHEGLSNQFRNRKVHRIYWALVHGTMKEKTKRIETQLGRHPKERKKFAVLPEGGKHAITHYQVQSTSPQGVSLLYVRLETGRTHQIRVHLSHLGHPILGDQTYGSNRFLSKLSSTLGEQIKRMSRIGLHAAELGFVHPRNGKELKFSTPWPEDLQRFVESIRW